jgi:hypothetical protein
MERSALSAEERDYRVKLPRPHPHGDFTVESMGRFVDRLMGHDRDAAEAEAALAHLWMSEEDMPEDPEPVEVPEPIPDADEPVRRGRWPGGERT